MPNLDRMEIVHKRRDELQRGLPFLYGQRMYSWQRAFFNALNKMCFICAANQVGKSTAQIRKAIHWATCPKLWPQLWPNTIRQNGKPNIFWYFYPDLQVADVEWRHKWIPLLPAGKYKDHAIYGWHEESGRDGSIGAVRFNSGVTIYFKGYSQKVRALQTATVYAVFADEELPEAYYHELTARTQGVQGYFSMVFTATVGQVMWQRTMEGKGDSEMFPDAFKQCVSLYDCMTFDDGTPGLFDEESIKIAIARCGTKAEVQRRIFGRFVVSEGLLYPEFDATRHFVKPFKIPVDYNRYVAVDPAGGGPRNAKQRGHPPALSFLAVRPDNRRGYIYKVWKGDDGRYYTAQDTLNKMVEIRGMDLMTIQRYDPAARDFATIAHRQGENFIPAIKDHAEGESIINTLFKNDMLFVFDDSAQIDPQAHKLATEFASLKHETAKNNRADDISDTVRYACISVPWDWSMLRGEKTDAEKKKIREAPLTPAEELAESIRKRRGDRYQRKPLEDDGWQELQAEIDEWNDAYGN